MITLRCLVDNAASRSGAFWGEHGVAFSIETDEGRLLFDTGQSGDVLVHNAQQMNLALDGFDALALSHAHYDHTGGLERFFSLSRPGIALYASPTLFRERYSLHDGQAKSIGLRLTQEEIARHAELRLSDQPTEMLPGVWTTGEIGERREFEGRSAHHYIRDGESWQPDPYQDDFSLVLQTAEGLVVVCGCCHAGLLNVLAHIRRTFRGEIRAIVGGTHLVKAPQKTLTHAIAVLRDGYGARLPDLYLNHCTGEWAFVALASAFGEKVHPCPAGAKLVFD